MNAAIFFLFFVSGACGLIYQVVWTRMMTHVFGSTVLAVSTVLAAFMTGLALGSYYLGKRGNRSTNPLKRYAVYEIGIGVTAVVVLLLLARLGPLSFWMTESLGSSPLLFAVVRFVVVFLLILVPTTLMGATLPILSQLVVNRQDRVGRMLGSLYVTNTIGAVAGCLLAGFYLIGSIGIHNSISLAAALNIVVGILSWILAGRMAKGTARAVGGHGKVAAESSQLEPLQRRQQALLLGGFALSGLTSFAYEVLWTRALVFHLGNSTYAFSTILATFLVGIALGGFLVRFFVDRLKNPLLFFAWVQLATGVSAVAAMPLLDAFMRLPSAQSWVGDIDAAWSSVLLMRFAVSFVVMLVPTILIGMTFPLAGKILVRNLERTGADVGKVYAVNTVGNIAGALAPAFVLIPLLGIHHGILAMGVVNLAVGVAIIAFGFPGASPSRRFVPVGVVGAASAALLPVLPAPGQFPSNTQEPGDEVLYYKEGLAATTKVFSKRLSGYKHISVDGIQIGGSNPEIDYKQQWLAHLPKLLLNDYKSELSIGLGSGILIGESALHEGLEQLVCVEIAPSVVEGAAFFASENRGILESPRAEIVVNDAVNFLQTSRDRYDIISTDGKTQPEYGVNGTFFSKEYYTLMRGHLNPGGLAIQWIPIHYPPSVFKTVLRTFSEVFPHTILWYGEGNCFLVGSTTELALDATAIGRKLADPEQRFDGLRKFGVTTSGSVLAQLIAGGDILREATAEFPENSLERPIIEFYDLADYAVPEVRRKLENLEFLMSIRGTGALADRIRAMPQEVRISFDAESQYLAGQRSVLAEGGRADQEKYFEKALAMDPGNQHLRHHIYIHYLKTGRDLMDAGESTRAEPFLRRAVEIWPHDADARYRYGYLLMQRGEAQKALDEFEATVALAPGRISLRHRLAKLYLRNRMDGKALVHLRAILEREPDDIGALVSLGGILGNREEFDEALNLLARAYEIAPDDSSVIDAYAWTAHRTGDRELAREIVTAGGDYAAESAEMQQRRQTMLK